MKSGGQKTTEDKPSVTWQQVDAYRQPAIETALAGGSSGTYALMDTLYSQVNPRLRRAAERNVLAHLLKLEAEGKVMRDGEQWRAA